jgi:large subunit ribosomal protein L25
MASKILLHAETGRPSGTGPARRLRQAGQVPGTVYGMGSEPVSVAVAWSELRKALTTDQGVNALITLEVDGAEHASLVKQIQRHPVRRDVIHVDFLRIDPTKPVTVNVPIVLTGESKAVNAMQGRVEQLVFNLTLKARPDRIPTEVRVDISKLEIGTFVTVSDIPLGDGVVADVDADISIAQGSATRQTILLQSEANKADDGDGAGVAPAGKGAKGKGGKGK